MALSSFAKLLSDRISYLANWKFNFQKTRVIGSLRYIDEALDNFVKGPFFTRFNKGSFFYMEVGQGDPSGHNQALFYEEALFLNYVIERWNFDISKLSKYEQEDYLLAVEKLKKWENVRKFMNDVEQFIGEIKRIVTIRRSSSYPQQFFIHRFPEYEWSVVSRYHAVLIQLEPYPEWAEKFKKEVEPQLKILADHSPVPLSSYPFKIFKGLDMHKYFR